MHTTIPDLTDDEAITIWDKVASRYFSVCPDRTPDALLDVFFRPVNPSGKSLDTLLAETTIDEEMRAVVKAFRDRKFNYQAFYTSVLLYQLPRDSEVKPWRLLTDENEWTEHTEGILRYIVSNHDYLSMPYKKEVDVDGYLIRLKCLIKALPKNQQIGFIVPLQVKKKSLDTALLGTTLHTYAGLSKDHCVVFSHAVEDALILASPHTDVFCPFVYQAGQLSTDHIECGVSKHVRYASVKFGSFLCSTNVHGRKNTSMLGVVAHDRYHQIVTSVTPLFIHAAKLLLCEHIRTDFGVKWSREIWAIIDGDSAYPLRPESATYPDAGIAFLVWMEDLAVSQYNRVAGDGILVSSNSHSCGRYVEIGASKTTILGKWLLLKLCFDPTFAENLNMSFDIICAYSDDVHSHFSKKGSTLRWRALMKTCREIQGFKEEITGFAELPMIMQLLHFSYRSEQVVAKQDDIMAEGNVWFVKPKGKGRFKNTIQLNMGLCARILGRPDAPYFPGRPFEQLQLRAYLPAVPTDAAAARFLA